MVNKSSVKSKLFGKVFRKGFVALLSLVILLSGTVGSTLAYIVKETNDILNVFGPEGITEFAISKQVVLPEGYTLPQELAFNFKVELGAEYANKTVATGNGAYAADSSGNITVTVKGNDSFTIYGLPIGKQVTVTEIEKEGYTVNGSATKSGVVTEDNKGGVTFINTYEPKGVKPSEYITISGTKVLDGRNWKEGDSFKFKLEYSENGVWKTLSTVESQGRSFSFGGDWLGLTLTKLGIHNFRITEVKEAKDGIIYDETVNTFTVEVTDKFMDGQVDISSVLGANNAVVTADEGKYTVAVTFTNKYDENYKPEIDDIAIPVTVNKTVTGSDKIPLDGFEFVLEDMNGVKLTAISKVDGKAYFDDLVFTKDDAGKSYTYKLYEAKGSIKNMEYDSKVYEIGIEIILNAENKLEAVITIDREISESILVQFTNKYVEPGPGDTGEEDDKEDSETPGKDPDEAPYTGDDTPVGFYIMIMAITLSMLVGLAMYRDKFKYSYRIR